MPEIHIEIKKIPTTVNMNTNNSLKAIGVYTGIVVLSYIGIKRTLKRIFITPHVEQETA
jgi:hypothetical protein